jgi:hypothetical protein
MRSVRWGVRADLFFFVYVLYTLIFLSKDPKAVFLPWMQSSGFIFGMLLICHIPMAQIIYTRDFTEKLLNANLRFTAPVESWYKVHAPCEDAYHSYDLCLVSEKDSAELKFIVLDEKATRKIQFPQVHFMSQAYHIATNDEGYWLRVSPEPSDHVLDKLKADWAGEVSFIPKKTITDKRFGKMYSIYKEETGMVVVILFYNHEYPGFNQHLRSVAFNSTSSN